MKDIYYIIRLKDIYLADLCLTTIRREFCGKIVNQTSSHLYFELNGSKALVIIPHEYIEWMAPSQRLWNYNNTRNEDTINSEYEDAR